MNEEFLRQYSMKRNFNLGQGEKDYYQNIALFILYQKAGKELVFKGGTALSKCYGLNRFSEDLDFTVSGEIDYSKILEDGLPSFNIKYTKKKRETIGNSESFSLKIEGPLYRGTERSLCSITFDFSKKEEVKIEAKTVQIGHHMDIIPIFEVFAMNEKEIMAEKIRAIITRRSARDLYDLAFLCNMGVTTDKNLANEKLAYYKKSYETGRFEKECSKLESIWKTELSSLVRNVPPFEETKTKVVEDIRKMMD